MLMLTFGIGVFLIGLLLSLHRWMGACVKLEKTKMMFGYYGDKEVNLSGRVIRHAVFDLTFSAIFTIFIKWFSINFLESFAGNEFSVLGEWGMTLLLMGIMLIISHFADNQVRVFLPVIVNPNSLRLAGIRESDSLWDMKWDKMAPVSIEKVKEINTLYFAHERLIEIEKQSSSVLPMGRETSYLVGRIETKKKEIIKELKEVLHELKKIEQIASERPNREKLLKNVQTFLDIPMEDESERTDIRELKRILESSRVPEKIKEQAKLTIEEILAKEKAYDTNHRQHKIDEAENLIQVAKTMNNIKE
ncbi:hypothetical protein JMA_38690 (plasmid) [Jeotgalibacillus malaysiensis]|uniref:Uncharacterized protein n=1 Tax=Jeotgalibacillus malaysiensis TaxID=1508404 RepID=A0A0B5AWW9_9BACL|nr:hypothetical protein [Jeotgalibacillus malaysiensis]AJD93187.1 hypothetical protein JMA_38690 [Jeotgalibacillus malaysiensis]